MRRVLEFLRSRFLWSIIISCIALGLMLTQFIYYYTYFRPGWYISEACFIGLILLIINRDEIPEFKMMWLVIMFVLRFPAIILYIICTSVRPNKKFFKRYGTAAAEIRNCFSQERPDTLTVSDDPAAATQMHYLSAAAGMPWVRNNDVTYYPLGENFHAALLESLEKAEQFIFLEYFIVEGGVMWDSIHSILRRKTAEGITVCVLYDDLGCVSTLPGNYDKRLEREGIRCIRTNRVSLIALSRLNNNRDHRKIAVIDGKTGFTGGINLADEYINAIEKHGHWKDTAVKIEGSGVENLTAMFLNMWNSQSKCHLEPDKYLPVAAPAPALEPEKGIVMPYGTGPQPLYRESMGKNAYMNLINAAQRYCYITTPYLICDHELLYALRLAAEKGVDIRIITPHIPDKKMIFWLTRSSYAELIADGVKIYEYTPGFIHAKTMVCDDKFAICGTINLDYRSFVHHFENAVWMYQVPCIADIKADFLHTQEKSQEITLEQAKMLPSEKLTVNVIKLFAPLL